MSQRPSGSGSPRQGQAPIEVRPPSARPARASSSGGPTPPRPDRGKVNEGLLLLPRLILFLLQVLVYMLGWLLFQLGRLLINVSKLREDPAPSMPLPPRTSPQPNTPQRPSAADRYPPPTSR